MLRKTSFCKVLAGVFFFFFFFHTTLAGRLKKEEKQETYFVCFAGYYRPVFCKQWSRKVLKVFKFSALWPAGVPAPGA